MAKDLDPVWKALADPTRRAILDLLHAGPRKTTEIVEAFPELSRFGVMKHIDVLRDAGLITTREEGRQRVNSLNAVPIRQIYERWVSRYQEFWTDSLLRALKTIFRQAALRSANHPKGPKTSKPRITPRRKSQQEKCMYTKDAIRYSLTLADQATMRSLATIEDAPLTFPTENGGCHPLWVIGHLAFIEGLTHEMLGGGGNPVAHWAAIFGQDTVPSADAAEYPALAKVRDQYVELRKRNLQLLESMSEADLDKPTPWQPTGLEQYFATFGKALLTVAMHQMGHRGQITDAFRAAGRAAPVLAGASA